MLLVELPNVRSSFVLLARRGGRYVRPVVGSVVDFRVEDSLKNVPRDLVGCCFVGRLPDLPGFSQVGLYVVSRFFGVEDELVDEGEALGLLEEPNFILLPSCPGDSLWDYVGAPWWEFVVIFDDDGGWVKAPRDGCVREDEPDASLVDERLDDVVGNVGRVRVVSPLVGEFNGSS